MATRGTAHFLNSHGIQTQVVNKVKEGRPHVVDMLKNGQIHMVINTPLGKVSQKDEIVIRRTAIERRIPCITTVAGAWAAVEGVRALRRGELNVRTLQEYHKGVELKL